MTGRGGRLLVFVGAALAGCGGGQGGGGDAGAGGGAPHFDGPHETLETPVYTLMSGEDRRYLCFSARLPEGRETIVTSIDPVYGKATHHLSVFSTLQDEPEGLFDCPEVLKDTWVPLYAAGTQSSVITLPEGTGIHLAPGAQVLVQIHLLNASEQVVKDKATIFLGTTTDAGVTPAGAFAISNHTINIPAQSSGVDAAMSCPVGREMNVFSVLGHMHRLGRHIALSRVAMPTDELLFGADTTYEDEPNVATSFHLGAMDTVRLACTYDNPTAATVGYGDVTADEMCLFVLYYTPFLSFASCP